MRCRKNDINPPFAACDWVAPVVPN